MSCSSTVLELPTVESTRLLALTQLADGRVRPADGTLPRERLTMALSAQFDHLLR